MKCAVLILCLIVLGIAQAFAEEVPRIHRTLVGSGERIQVARGSLELVATTQDVPSSESEELVAPPPPESVTASWISGGITVVVTIYRQPGETDEAMAVRLAKRVNAMRVSFPIDPAPGGGGG